MCLVVILDVGVDLSSTFSSVLFTSISSYSESSSSEESSCSPLIKFISFCLSGTYPSALLSMNGDKCGGGATPGKYV
jgi:hypothetical protein